MCIWDGCTELGTFDHIAWECPRGPCNIPTPAKFLCLLGMVGSLQIKFVTLMCAWLVDSCARDALVPCPSMTCACLYQGPSYLPAVMVLPTCTPFGVALPSWAYPLGLAWFVWVFAPLVSFFCGVGWFFAGLFAPLVWSGRLGLPTPCSRLFPLGICPRCSWRAFVVGCCGCCCGCPLALRCLFGGSSGQSSHSEIIPVVFSAMAP